MDGLYVRDGVGCGGGSIEGEVVVYLGGMFTMDMDIFE